MNGKVLNLTYASSLTNFSKVNSSFDSGKLRIAYTGVNRNGSSISKDAFERAIQSIYNCPVVCNYDRETDSIGGHDMEVVRDGDGGLKLVNTTTPVGVIPESANIYWENVEEEDGTINEYLCADTLIWKRQEAYKKLKTDGCAEQSMEITVKDGQVKDGVYEVYDFEFTAFCLLGDCEPCFESASLEFSKKNFKEQFSQMMLEMKENFSTISGSIKADKFSMKGGSNLLEDKLKLLKEFGLDETQTEFDLDSLTYDELFEALNEKKKVKDEEDVVEDPQPAPPSDGGEGGSGGGEGGSGGGGEGSGGEGGSEGKDPEGGEGGSEGKDPEGGEDTDPKNPEETQEDQNGGNFALAGNIREELCKSVRAIESYTDAWDYECARYWYMDHSDDKGEVYCCDNIEGNLCAFNYSVIGDAVSLDLESKKRVKYEIVDFDGGNQKLPTSEIVAEMFSNASETIESMKSELEELRQFKADIESEQAKAEKDAMFERFEDLSGVEEFETLKSDCDQFDLDTLEEKCFAIRGKKVVLNFSVEKPKATKLKVERAEMIEKEPYGGLFEKYNK